MSRKARKGAPEPEGRQSAEAAEEVRVVLKPVLGIRPGTYLTVLYAVILLFLVYLFLFLPGIRKNGTWFSMRTYPASASVRVDGKYAGTTPCEIFVPRGGHRIEFHRSFHKDVFLDEQVKGRVFGTLIFPKRDARTVSLELEDPEKHFMSAFMDFASNQHIPTIISDAMVSIGTALKKTHSDANYDMAYSFIYDCMHYVTTETQLRSLLSASTLAASGGSIFSPTSLIRLVQKTIQLKGNDPDSPAWIVSCLGSETSKQLLASAWIKSYSNHYKDSISKFYQGSPLGKTSTIYRSVAAGIAFCAVPSGTLVMGDDDRPETLGSRFGVLLPHPVEITSFRISETEITNRQYKAFLDENAEWRKSRTAELVKKTIVTEDYLSSWNDDSYAAGSEDLPVVGVSRFAAQAYCAWLTSKLGRGGTTARLPTEAEWEWSARGGLRGMPYPTGEKAGNSVFFVKGITGPGKAGASEANGYGLRDMAGNVWEWCADDHAPASYFFSAAVPHGPDAAVRGGAWNNPKESVKVFTRGCQPEAWCTPYLGFRVVLSGS